MKRNNSIFKKTRNPIYCAQQVGPINMASKIDKLSKLDKMCDIINHPYLQNLQKENK